MVVLGLGAHDHGGAGGNTLVFAQVKSEPQGSFGDLGSAVENIAVIQTRCPLDRMARFTVPAVCPGLAMAVTSPVREHSPSKKSSNPMSGSDRASGPSGAGRVP